MSSTTPAFNINDIVAAVSACATCLAACGKAEQELAAVKEAYDAPVPTVNTG